MVDLELDMRGMARSDMQHLERFWFDFGTQNLSEIVSESDAKSSIEVSRAQKMQKSSNRCLGTIPETSVLRTRGGGWGGVESELRRGWRVVWKTSALSHQSPGWLAGIQEAVQLILPSASRNK